VSDARYTERNFAVDRAGCEARGATRAQISEAV
jgi:hypothetical protein